MKLDELTRNVKNKLNEGLNIKNTLSIMNVPKQTLLDKGDLVVLMNDKNKPLVTEFLKDGKYHVEFKNSTFPKLLVDSILKSSSTRLFEVNNFSADLDMDYYIDYSKLSTSEKKDIRTFVKSSENKLRESSQRYGKMSNESLKKTIKAQNGSFTVWMDENGHTVPDSKCLKEAYDEAQKRHDVHLKKRASAAKCFYKISMVRKNG